MGPLHRRRFGHAISLVLRWQCSGTSVCATVQNVATEDEKRLVQVQRDYGVIRGYVAPVSKLPGSIMNLSNTGGAGRGSDSGNIIGDVIMHGKKEFWSRGSGASYHYHQGMKAGDNTLEALITRLVMGSLTEKGDYDAGDVQQRCPHPPETRTHPRNHTHAHFARTRTR